MFDTVLSYLAPHDCASCGQQGSILCEQCKYDIVSEPPQRCLLCLVPTRISNLCTTCRQKSGIEDAWYVGERSGGLKRLIDEYKFRSALAAASHITSLIDARLPLFGELVVCPVPTAPAHRRARGFDHTARLARALADKRRLPYRSLLGRETSETQHFKSRADRFASAERSIVAQGDVPQEVLLIDDILTTGATVDVCVRRLKEAGAKTVYVAICARQP